MEGINSRNLSKIKQQLNIMKQYYIMNKAGEVLQCDWSWSDDDDCMRRAELFQSSDRAKQVMVQVINRTAVKWNEVDVYFTQ